MITEWIVSVGTSIALWFSTLFDEMELPDWAVDGLEATYSFLDDASGVGHWFAWQTLSTVVGGLVTLFLVTFGAKLIREVAKHIPFVGGGG